jgi:hypothetical protein
MDFSDCTTTYEGLVHTLSAFLEHHACTFKWMVWMMKKKRGTDCTDQEAEKLVLVLLSHNPAEDVWGALTRRHREAAAREAEEASFLASAIRNAGDGALRLALKRSLSEATPTCPCTTCTLVCVCERKCERV